MRWGDLVPGSLRLRVALSTALVAAFVGLGAAGVAAALVGRLSTEAEDERLRDAAGLLLREIELEGGDARVHADEEAREIKPFGLGIALFERRGRIGGSHDVVYLTEPGCSSRTDAAGEIRTCALGDESRRVVVTARRTPHERRQHVLLLAVLAAALAAALVGAVVSRALAGWALAPLTELEKRLDQVAAAAPGEADLGPPTGATEVETLRAALRDLLRRLGESLERSQGFAASAAHELRTPLTTMMAELDLAAEQSPASAQSLARVRRTVGRMSVLVEHLLTLASPAGARIEDAVAIEDVVREVVASRSEGERQRVDVNVAGAGMVRGDEALLRIIVDNLVDNALKFSTGRVRVSINESTNKVEVIVVDDGPGVDLDERARLFAPFVRGKNTSVAGHGLGLAIVLHAARLHGGDVRFVGREKGTEVRVDLPAWSAVS